MRYWFVNQGKTFDEEKEGGFIYAPLHNESGKSFQHWLDVGLVKKGDIIFCNKAANILAIAKAESDGYESAIPESIRGGWASPGYKVDLKYYELKTPLRFSDYKEEYKNLENTPFDVNGNAKVGYLFSIGGDLANILVDKIEDDALKRLVKGKDRPTTDYEELREEEEQLEVINAGKIKPYTDKELELREEREKTYHYISKIKEAKARKVKEHSDPKLKAKMFELAKYSCEVNRSHRTFTNSTGLHQYLECHHIIPLSAQEDFPTIKLDSKFNLIAICPICHRQVHHAVLDERRAIFKKMYEARKNEMESHGFDPLKIDEIFKKYYS